MGDAVEAGRTALNNVNDATQLYVDELIPAPDPWATALRFADWPHLLCLDSAHCASPLARYSYVCARPRRWIEWRVGDPLDPFEAMATRLADRSTKTDPTLPPFQGGLAGMFGYGLGRAIERLPAPEFDEFNVPDLAVGIYDWVVSFDHVQNRAWLVSHNDSDFEEIQEYLRLPTIASRFGQAPVRQHPVVPSTRFALNGHAQIVSNFTRADYEAAVRRAIDYIHNGDCFQVNLSQRLLTPLTESPLAVYGRLRVCNPAPFAAYLDLGDSQVLSASPERFLSMTSAGEIATRPIKGTRRRGATPAEDFALRDDLSASAKDQAENLMIVDLLRNDLGRVCEFGSIQVAKLFERESYATVHHLVSEVRGRLRSGLGPIDLLRATFPGGSVTGAPKIRAMEIITELERVARGPYCGSIGWIGFDGAMDSNILIRTLTASGGWLQFPVGGGIVADSNPAREYEETLHKAEGMLRALAK